MAEFHDFFINPEIREDAESLGWSSESIKASVKVLEAADWGELKRKIDRNRGEYDILAFHGGDHELNRKAFSDSRMDVVLHPGRGRKDSGMNHVDAEKAAENDVAVGFSLKEVPEDSKRQSQELSKWRRNLKLCEKYGTPYIITTEAREFSELRKPHDLASVIDSLSHEGIRALKSHAGSILERRKRAQSDSEIRPGHEVVEE
ncbi:MAG: RNase P subunit p30 family protein [Candidatus Nanohalobium sp.]